MLGDTKDDNLAIVVQNLTKKFGKITAVDNISFSVKKGEFFAFLGPNGAGKSTTINMLTTLLAPTKGKMMVNGFDPLRDQDEVRKSFGIVFQDQSLDDELTAYENMKYHGVLYGVPSSLRQKRTKELLDIVELWARKDDFVKTFSGGMKRRLEIARGLLHHPRILFLDEPTLGLDPQTRNKIWSYIKKLNAEEKVTIFFTTHYMEEAARIAEMIAIIDHGKIIASGTAKKLQEQTDSDSLEDAFLALTGKNIREEEADSFDKIRMMRNARMRR